MFILEYLESNRNQSFDLQSKILCFPEGDVAFVMLDHIVINHPESCMDIGTEIIISDINQPMLDVGKSKAERIKIEEGIFLQNLAFSHL